MTYWRTKDRWLNFWTRGDDWYSEGFNTLEQAQEDAAESPKMYGWEYDYTLHHRTFGPSQFRDTRHDLSPARIRDTQARERRAEEAAATPMRAL